MTRWERMTDRQRRASSVRVQKWKKAHRDKSRKQGRESAQRMRAARPGEAASAMKKWRGANPARNAATKRRAHLKKYGLTEGAYVAMLRAQGGKCAICRTTKPGVNGGKSFPVDHCHMTGRVRGLLCSACNVGIGMFQDDVSLVARAQAYLIERK